MAEPEPGSPERDDRRWRLLGVLVCASMIACTLPSLHPGVRDWDNVVKLQVAWNMVRGNGPVLTQPTPDDAQYVAPGRDGRYYTLYPPFAYVLQFITIGVNAAGGPVIEGAPTVVVLGLVAWAVVSWGRRSGVSPAGAVAGAMLTCFGTVLWPMAAKGYDNLIEALALGMMLWAGAGEERRRAWLWAGLLLGLAFATRVGAGVLGVPGLVLILTQSPRDARAVLRRGLSLALGCAPGIALVLWFNQLRFGAPFRPYGGSLVHGALEQLMAPWFSGQHWTGIAGLSVSPGKGLLWYGPPLIFTLLFAAPVFRRHGRALAALSAYVVAGLTVFGRFNYWHSDWAWGPRYVAPMCLAAAPLAWWLSESLESRRPLGRMAILAALPLAVALQTVPVVGYPVETYVNSNVATLSQSGLLVTSPATRPPLPADQQLLYFRLDTSPIRCLPRNFAVLLGDPVHGPQVREALALAMLVPALVLTLVLVAAAEDRRHRLPPAAGARAG
jgi:hypothetical protein